MHYAQVHTKHTHTYKHLYWYIYYSFSEESSNGFKETKAQNVCEVEVHRELNQRESDQEYVNAYVNDV